MPVDRLQPQQRLTFEDTSADTPWARLRVEKDAHGGAFALGLSGADEYVPLTEVRAGDVGVDVNAVRLSLWIKVQGKPGRLRTILQRTDASGVTAKYFSRIIRPEELVPGTWMELHTQMDLPEPAAPDARLTVLLWNEGGAVLSADDAVITFVSADVPGRASGQPFDMDSMSDGRMPDGRTPSVDTLEHARP